MAKGGGTITRRRELITRIIGGDKDAAFTLVLEYRLTDINKLCTSVFAKNKVNKDTFEILADAVDRAKALDDLLAETQA